MFKNNFIYKIIIIFSFFCICINGSVFAENNSYDVIDEFTQRLGIVLDKENIDAIEIDQFVQENDYSRLVSLLRKQGCPVTAYEIKNKEDIFEIDYFLTYLDGRGLVFVENISQGHLVLFTNGRQFNITTEAFFEEWIDPVIISYFLTDMWLNDFSIIKDIEETHFFIIYSYHDENFSLLEKAVKHIFDIAESEGKKVIFIDELGLIPEDAIKRKMQVSNIREEDAFSQIKESIFRENEMLEKGIPLNIGTESYRKLYRLLAKYRIKSIVEDLKYQNWKDIVKLDQVPFIELEYVSFLVNDLDKYFNTAKINWETFWKFNVDVRDDNFSDQVLRELNKYDEYVFFTIRGIGHYGLEERLSKRGIKADFITIGKGQLEDNLNYQQIYQVYSTLGINIPEQIKVDLILKAKVEEYLRLYFYTFEGLNLREATLKANKICKKISVSDINNISSLLSKNLSTLKTKEGNEIYIIVYQFLLENGFID